MISKSCIIEVKTCLGFTIFMYRHFHKQVDGYVWFWCFLNFTIFFSMESRWWKFRRLYLQGLGGKGVNAPTQTIPFNCVAAGLCPILAVSGWGWYFSPPTDFSRWIFNKRKNSIIGFPHLLHYLLLKLGWVDSLKIPPLWPIKFNLVKASKFDAGSNEIIPPGWKSLRCLNFETDLTCSNYFSPWF